MPIYDVNAAIDKPDLLGSFRKGEQYGAARRAQVQAQQDNAALRGLAPQIIAGDPAAMAQGAAINPEAAAKYQSAGDNQWRRISGLVNFIKDAKKSGNPQAVEAAWQQARPYIAKTTGVEPPATFAEAEPHFGQLEARIAMVGQEKEQRNLAVSPGSAIVDPQTGQVVYERPFAPANASIVKVPDGTNGTVDMVFDPKTRQLSMPQYPGASAPPPRQPEMTQVQYATSDGQPVPQEEQPALAAAMAASARGEDFDIPVGGALPPRLDMINGGNAAPGALGYTPAKREAAGYQTMTPEEVKALGLPDGTIAQRGPTGQVQIINKPRDLPSGGQVIDNGDGTTTYIPAGKVSEGERNAAGFYQRMVSADKELDALSARNYDPTNARDYVTVGKPLINALSTPEGQQYHQAAQNWVRANLRKESGAAIGAAEMDQEIRNYFPQFGDSPQVIEQKAKNRKVVEQAMRTAAGAALAPVSGRPAAAPARVQSAADYEALPSGATYIAPDGTQRRKR